MSGGEKSSRLPSNVPPSKSEKSVKGKPPEPAGNGRSDDELLKLRAKFHASQFRFTSALAAQNGEQFNAAYKVQLAKPNDASNQSCVKDETAYETVECLEKHPVHYKPIVILIPEYDCRTQTDALAQQKAKEMDPEDVEKAMEKHHQEWIKGLTKTDEIARNNAKKHQENTHKKPTASVIKHPGTQKSVITTPTANQKHSKVPSASTVKPVTKTTKTNPKSKIDKGKSVNLKPTAPTKTAKPTAPTKPTALTKPVSQKSENMIKPVTAVSSTAVPSQPKGSSPNEVAKGSKPQTQPVVAPVAAQNPPNAQTSLTQVSQTNTTVPSTAVPSQQKGSSESSSDEIAQGSKSQAQPVAATVPPNAQTDLTQSNSPSKSAEVTPTSSVSGTSSATVTPSTSGTSIGSTDPLTGSNESVDGKSSTTDAETYETVGNEVVLEEEHLKMIADGLKEGVKFDENIVTPELENKIKAIDSKTEVSTPSSMMTPVVLEKDATADKIVEALTKKDVILPLISVEDSKILNEYFNQQRKCDEEVIAALSRVIDKILDNADNLYDDKVALKQFLENRGHAKSRLLDAMIMRKGNFLQSLYGSIYDAALVFYTRMNNAVEAASLVANQSVLKAREMADKTSKAYAQTKDAVYVGYARANELAEQSALATKQSIARANELAEQSARTALLYANRGALAVTQTRDDSLAAANAMMNKGTVYYEQTKAGLTEQMTSVATMLASATSSLSSVLGSTSSASIASTSSAPSTYETVPTGTASASTSMTDAKTGIEPRSVSDPKTAVAGAVKSDSKPAADASQPASTWSSYLWGYFAPTTNPADAGAKPADAGAKPPDDSAPKPTDASAPKSEYVSVPKPANASAPNSEYASAPQPADASAKPPDASAPTPADALAPKPADALTPTPADAYAPKPAATQTAPVDPPPFGAVAANSKADISSGATIEPNGVAPGTPPPSNVAGNNNVEPITNQSTMGTNSAQLENPSSKPEAPKSGNP